MWHAIVQILVKALSLLGIAPLSPSHNCFNYGRSGCELMPRLLTIEDAATHLGVPRGSLRNAAERHGFLVSIGRTQRIDLKTIPEFIEKCREKPPGPASTADPTPEFTSSVTQDTESAQRALEIADELKERSPGTSPKRNSPPAAQLRRKK